MTNTDQTTRTDVHDMVVVHRAFRREFRLIPELVRAVPAGDTARAAVLAGHADLMLTGLHLHHTSEDLLLWPKLLDRAAPDAATVHRMEAQHHRVEACLAALGPTLVRWRAEARPAVSEEVAAGFDELRGALLEHLDDEEALILPIAAAHLTQAEWDEIGEHGVAGMTAAQLPLMFGMVLEEASPAERAAFDRVLPLPARLVLKTWGAWAYRRHVIRVRGA